MARRLPALVGMACASALVGAVASITLGGASGSTPAAQQQCSQMHANVYERINPRTQASLLTTVRSEADDAAKRSGFTVNMGAPFQAGVKSAPGLSKVMRLRNARTLDFFWTTSMGEARRAVSHYGYKMVSSTFYAAPQQSVCDIAVYRYQRGGHHRYTVSASERAALAHAGWRFEGIAFYGVSPAAPQPTLSSTGKSSPSPTPTPSKASPSSRPSSSTSSSQQPTPSESKTAPSSPPATSGGSGPLSRPLYIMPSGHPWTAYESATDPTTKRELWQIAGTPRAFWLGGTSGDEAKVDQIESAAVGQGATPEFVLYAIPHRDCGHYSAGGLSSTAQYESWVDSVRNGIGGRPAVVIVEPDAIGWGCLSPADQAARIAMLKYAMRTLSQDPNTWVYVHAGSSGLSPQGIANNLKAIGIEYARGFAVNVSSFDATSSEIAYGKAIDAALGMQKHFVIDTSRNGLGRNTGSNGGAPGWCNPPGRAIGSRPTTQTADPLVDAYLWVKTPGGSDGDCHAGDPPAGGWYQSYALGLVQRALAAKTIDNRSTGQ